jgi:nucleoporin NUP159
MSAVTSRMPPAQERSSRGGDTGDDKDANRNSGKSTRLLSSNVAPAAWDCKQILQQLWTFAAYCCLLQPVYQTAWISANISERRDSNRWGRSPLLRSFSPTLSRSISDANIRQSTPPKPSRLTLSAQLPRLRMAFSFSNAAASGGDVGGIAQSSAGAQVSDGPELREIQTDQLGFSAINGDTKVRLLPNPWPLDNLPPPTSSLLAVAATKGLLAAAGPDTLVLAQTSTVRNAFHAPQDGTDTVKPVKPEFSISMPRLSHIAFSADESVLVASPEQGGGIAAYQVSQLTSGNTSPAMQLSTNNTSLRALVPNPAADTSNLFAAVTTNGELLVADLNSGALAQGPAGSVLKSGVSCVSWSNKGKALVAGLGDGTATQMKADGTVMAEIPKSTSIPANMHLSAISWLENDTFFAVYTPNDTPSEDQIPPSEYWIISRTKNTSIYSYQKLPEVCGTWGMRRMPSFHYVSRLRNFPPHILDLLVVASTTSNELGLVSKASQPLSTDEATPGSYTFTTIGDDIRRAALPLSQSGSEDTSPIGVGLDLSSTEEVVNPIPSDPEIRQSSTPLPNYLVLNNEGILSSWWVVYNDSIREKTMYSGLAAASGTQQASMLSPAPSRDTTPAQSTPVATGGFGSTGLGSSTPFAKPSASAFPTPAASTAFGGGTAPAFGQSSSLGGAKPSWASTGFAGTPAPQTAGSGGFGKPAFGSATPIGGGSAAPTFGGPSALGGRPTPFGGAATPSFGQTGGLGKFGAAPPASPFSGSTSTTSGFASFAGTNGSSGFGAAKSDGESPFTKPSGDKAFGAPSTFGSNVNGPSMFRPAKPFSGLDSPTVFTIESSFEGDGTAKNDLPKPANLGGFGFGGSFGDMVGEQKKVTSPTHDKEAEMGGDSDEKSTSVISVKDDASESAEEEIIRPTETAPPLVTPPSTLNQSKSTPAPPLSGLFGNGAQAQNTTPQPPHSSAAGFSFSGLPSTTPKETPVPKSTIGHQNPLFNFDQTPKQSIEEQDDDSQTPTESPERAKNTPDIKAEPPSDDETTNLRNIPEAPLPPDPTSKASYSIGGTSASSDRSRVISDEDAPLPPDFLPPSKNQDESGPPVGPEDDGEFSSDFEGSGEDVTQDISPIEGASADNTDQIQMSPESSFGRAGDKSFETSPTGGLFTKVTSGDQSQKSSRALFGEVGSGLVFAPPTKPQESPRSPSPVRKTLHTNLLRPDAARSVSAPSKPASLIEQRRAQLGQSGLSGQAFPPRESSATRAQAQAKVLADAKAKAEAEAAELEDDEDERLRQELALPVTASQDLAAFVPFQQSHSEEASKTGIPGQIERLYQDINSMIDTLGINARSLSSFMLYQQCQEENDAWPSILTSETPLDVLNDEWVAGDITRLHEGISTLDAELASRKPGDVATKLQQCQELLSRDLPHVRTISTAVRRTLDNQIGSDSNHNIPLSAEQASIQHDLRKAATNVQLKLTQAEETLSVLRAKLAESAPKKDNGLSRSSSQRKPTVEAVANTIAKMTAMAEAKSTEIDVLEVKLKKLDLTFGRQGSVEPEITSERLMSNLRLSSGDRTPGSSSNSVYHTPDSKFSRSMRSPPGLRSSMNGNGAVVSAEDRQVWRQKAARKKEVASVLKKVLLERNQAKAKA